MQLKVNEIKEKSIGKVKINNNIISLLLCDDYPQGIQSLI